MPAEAATEKEFVERVRYYGNHFWLLYDSEKLIAFVDGFVTDEPDLTDDMYENAAMHNENGAWQMIFGVNTLPDYRKHGYAGKLIRHAIDDAKLQGRKGLVLTCKERLRRKILMDPSFSFDLNIEDHIASSRIRSSSSCISIVLFVALRFMNSVLNISLARGPTIMSCSGNAMMKFMQYVVR